MSEKKFSDTPASAKTSNYRGLIERYRDYLSVSGKTPVVTLLEGNTPLIRASNLAAEIGFSGEIYLKYEGMNPTGSFKDRGMTMAISKAAEAGSSTVICASTGNTSASAAAYAARAKMRCVVLIPDGAIALGKLSQALVHGAEVFAVSGNFDEALNIVRELSEKYPLTLVNSVNPYRIEGQKTAAFEIIETLGRAPDFHFIPVGNAGNITAYWKGYKEYADGKFFIAAASAPYPLSTIHYPLPHMMGFQAEGAAPIVRGAPVAKPETVATAIRIGNPASWRQAVEARDESLGAIDIVTDDEILAAYKLLARSEGVFCEPASAASVAGLIKYKKIISDSGGSDGKDSPVAVCTLTGHGLKDPDCAVKNSSRPMSVPCDAAKIVSLLGIKS
ncbi:MAG: threonine synthase [Elusimicrobia bacterium HGW-Elusimicrobia-1]|jgi:threonine synthase|nr:MAG: threonine synthase [Elusimicrobia bacterium HGW-Elusimicrobia-1]